MDKFMERLSAIRDLGVPMTDLEPRTRYDLLNFSRSVYTIEPSPFPIESYLDPVNSFKWMRQNFWTSWIFAGVYIVAIFVLQAVMRNQQPMKLKVPLVLWNAALCFFSFVGSLRLVPHILLEWHTYGLHRVVCMSRVDDPLLALWSSLFVFSKIVELGDTLFLILRKRPVIFLHWYHHAVTLVFTWFGTKDDASAGRLTMSMNIFVHSIMYGYYALRALQVKVPRPVSMTITLLQILQMTLAVLVILTAAAFRQTPLGCDFTPFHAFFGVMVFGSYLLLFASFFREAYFRKHKNVDKKE